MGKVPTTEVGQGSGPDRPSKGEAGAIYFRLPCRTISSSTSGHFCDMEWALVCGDDIGGEAAHKGDRHGHITGILVGILATLQKEEDGRIVPPADNLRQSVLESYGKSYDESLPWLSEGLFAWWWKVMVPVYILSWDCLAQTNQ